MSRVVLVGHPAGHPHNLPNVNELPGLYHPKVGNVQPFCEIAMGVLLPRNEGF
jgi:hypothetical protein